MGVASGMVCGLKRELLVLYGTRHYNTAVPEGLHDGCGRFMLHVCLGQGQGWVCGLSLMLWGAAWNVHVHVHDKCVHTL